MKKQEMKKQEMKTPTVFATSGTLLFSFLLNLQYQLKKVVFLVPGFSARPYILFSFISYHIIALFEIQNVPRRLLNVSCVRAYAPVSCAGARYHRRP